MGDVRSGLILVFFSLIAIERCSSFKVLLITGPRYSHCHEIGVIGVELLNRGHDVTIYLRDDIDYRRCIDHPRVKHILYPGLNIELDDKSKRKLHEDSFADKPLSLTELFNLTGNIAVALCTDLLTDTASIRKLKEEAFDLVIVNGLLFLQCFFALPYMLKIPYVTVGSYISEIYNGQVFAPHFIPAPMSRFASCDMSLSERVNNAVFQLVVFAAGSKVGGLDIIHAFVPELSPSKYSDLYLNSELFIENTDPIFSCPKPTLPNFIQVGGLLTSPSNPLNTDLEQFYTEAANGVIVVSFGSVISFLPDKILRKLFKAFESIEMSVLFRWKHIDAPQNVKIVTWLPQNDVLGHPKTKLLIYHCGRNGIFESIYHGVPIICLPLVADQHYNSQLVRYRGLGFDLDINSFTVDELVSAINSVLSDSSFRNASRHMSAILKSRPETPVQRAANAVEEILRFGGAHLRSPGSTLPMYQYLLLDMWFIIIVIPICSFFVAVKLIVKLVFYMCRQKTRR